MSRGVSSGRANSLTANIRFVVYFVINTVAAFTRRAYLTTRNSAGRGEAVYTMRITIFSFRVLYAIHGRPFAGQVFRIFRPVVSRGRLDIFFRYPFASFSTNGTDITERKYASSTRKTSTRKNVFSVYCRRYIDNFSDTRNPF